MSKRELGDGEPSQAPQDWAENWARDFHDTYERTAPKFGYQTREESAVPWAEVPENNRKLMIAVCAEVLCRFEKWRSGAAQEVSPRQKAMQAAKEIESDCIEQSDEGYAFEVSRAAIIIEKLLGEEVSPPSPWRQGSKVPTNIYEGDRPICQTHTVGDAKRIVESVNRGDTRELKAALRKIREHVQNYSLLSNYTAKRDAVEAIRAEVEKVLG